MLISLVLATLNRTQEPARFLHTLDAQTHRHFELIVVDQNPDERLNAILAQYDCRFSLVHLRCEPGVSRARNLGILAARGEILGFPDDDCWYPPDLLQKVVASLRAEPRWDGVSGRCAQETSNPGQAGMARFAEKPGIITSAGVWTRSCAATLFVRREVFDQIGGFDESLGPGAGTPWESAEDMEYVLRAVRQGTLLFYDPGLVVLHASPPSLHDERAYERAFAYGMGIGRVLRIHEQPLWLVLAWWIRAFAGMALSLFRMDFRACRFYFRSLQGRLRGWFSARGACRG